MANFWSRQGITLWCLALCALFVMSCKAITGSRNDENKTSVSASQIALVESFPVASGADSLVELVWLDHDIRLNWERLSHNFKVSELMVWAATDSKLQPPGLDPNQQYQIGDRLATGHELIYQGEVSDLRLTQSQFRDFWIVERLEKTKAVSYPARVPVHLDSCSRILQHWPASTTGIYKLYHQAGDRFAYCDMSTASGGWTLALHYFKKAEAEIKPLALVAEMPRLSRRGRLGLTTFGDLEGHLGQAAVAALKPSELRFFCQSSRHSRRLHFRTWQTGCLSYLTDGSHGCADLLEAWEPMPDHSGQLPQAMEGGLTGQEDLAMLEMPFGVWGGPSWKIPALTGLWSCDESAAPLSAGDWLRFEIWVR